MIHCPLHELGDHRFSSDMARVQVVHVPVPAEHLGSEGVSD